MQQPNPFCRFAARFAGLLVMVIAGANTPVHADTLYVIDKVLINVYAEPNQDSSRVATIETGDAVLLAAIEAAVRR